MDRRQVGGHGGAVRLGSRSGKLVEIVRVSGDVGGINRQPVFKVDSSILVSVFCFLKVGDCTMATGEMLIS